VSAAAVISLIAVLCLKETRNTTRQALTPLHRIA
jgi:hypothetical protein